MISGSMTYGCIQIQTSEYTQYQTAASDTGGNGVRARTVKTERRGGQA